MGCNRSTAWKASVDRALFFLDRKANGFLPENVNILLHRGVNLVFKGKDIQGLCVTWPGCIMEFTKAFVPV
jgi:hypothetical protein